MSAGTKAHEGPSGHAVTPDYTISFEAHPTRVRVEFNGVTVADSARAMVFREARYRPVFYFPPADVRLDLMERTDHHTHCPFKGNASYWTLRIGERSAENAAWSYEDPLKVASAMKGYIAFYDDRMDAWYEDEDQVYVRGAKEGAPRDNPLVDWLLSEAWEAATSRELTRRFSLALVETGIPLARVRVVIQTLHPLLAATVYRWSAAAAEKVEKVLLSHETMRSDQFLQSPLRPIFDGVGGFRRWLDASDEDDFPVLRDLKAEGMTDYAAMPMPFSDGQINAITLATDAPGGFSTAGLGRIHEILPVLSRFYEVQARRRNAVTLLQTFLGKHTGKRVLDGLIKRGDGENIHAVIWFCDLRDSTPLAQSVSREAFLAHLNLFFDCMAGAVVDNGGEVLRFIGDAVLAIFPVADSERTGREGAVGWAEACEMAAQAAREADRRIAELNRSSAGGDTPPLRFGIGLHVGDVTYGNIGTAERLEFTVIGAAANQASRIEGMSRSLRVPIVMSSEFAAEYPGEVRSLGRHRLRGMAGRHELYTLAGGAPLKATPSMP
ncbi:MAG: DUF427 domain-containing protein [Rhodospirillales bacterium]